MCLAFKVRQARMGVDDWGREIRAGREGETVASEDGLESVDSIVGERRSLLDRSSPSRKR
jgi:hypothetical protein